MTTEPTETTEVKSAKPSLTDQTLAENVETLEVDNFIETYQITAEWIRFADAKATVVLSVAGILAGMLIPTLKPFLDRNPSEHFLQWWPIVVGILFAGWLLFTCLSSIWAFLCVYPFRQKGQHPSLHKCAHFHAAAISHQYSIEDTDAFINDCESLGMSGIKKEVLTGLLIDAHISSRKYSLVTKAIKFLGISAIFGLFYLLATQF